MLMGKNMINETVNKLKTTEKFEIGRQAWTRINMATVIHAMQEIGAEKYINELWKREFPFIKGLCEKINDKYHLDGDTAMNTFLIQMILIKGFGFNWHFGNVVEEQYIESSALWCPQTQAVHEMGIIEGAELMPIWCDMYSTQIGKTVGSVYVCHAYCPACGDNMCRTGILKVTEDSKFDEDHIYQEITRLKPIIRQDLKPYSSELFEGPLPPIFDEFTPEMVAQEGAELLGRCTCHSILTAAYLIGWKELIQLVQEKQSYGYRYAAMKTRTDLNVLGNDLQDAAALVMLNYESMGMFGRKCVEVTPDRIEIVGNDICPMVAAAKDAGLEESSVEASLWCDFYQNNSIKIFDKDYKCSHIHCPLKGDKECRLIIQSK